MGLEDKGRNVVIHHLGGATVQFGRVVGIWEIRRDGQEGQAGPSGVKPEVKPEGTAEPARTTDYD